MNARLNLRKCFNQIGFKSMLIISLVLVGCQSSQKKQLSSGSSTVSNKQNVNTQTSQVSKSTELAKKASKQNTTVKKPTAQQTANVVGIASIAGALVAAARGDNNTAINILNAGSSVVKAAQPQSAVNSSQSTIGSSATIYNANTVQLSGRCGLPKTEASEFSRRSNYNELSKAQSLGIFHSDTALKQQVNSASVPSGFSSYCSAAGAQVTAILPSFNNAVINSNKLVNGQPLGLTCSGNQNSASHANACTALKLKYAMQQAAFACHYSCEQGK